LAHVPRLILASGSRTRSRLLLAAGIAHDQTAARVDEQAVKESLLAEGADGRRIASLLAEMKAVRVGEKHREALVLGADQVLTCGGRMFSKCRDLEAAKAQLRNLRGNVHELHTALVIAEGSRPVWRFADRARLWMRAFSDAFLDDYLEACGEDVLSSVGAYQIEGRGVQLMERVEGNHESILGLPLLPLLGYLRERGVVRQ